MKIRTSFEYLEKKIKNNKWEVIFFVIIVAIGIFLRSYNFSEWLHFEIDQDYDILLVDRAVENGIASLPLLGPNAGGGNLRLGPAYYYMQYVSALIFGNTPAGNAVFILLFSILALPLFYFFSRRYFSKIVSLGLLAIFSISLFPILYSRFAWSPNVLPFLMLLAFYALLRSVAVQESGKNKWFLLAVFLLAIITQIHFNVFFVTPAIFIAFLLIKRPRFNYKIWIAAAALVMIVYSPMIANYIKTSGKNVAYFAKKISKTSDYPKNIAAGVVQNLHYFSSEFFLIDSGIDKINGGRIKGFGFQKDEKLLWKIATLTLFLIEMGFLSYAILKLRKIKSDKKDFLMLSFVWFAVFFAYFYVLIVSYKMESRFFLPLEPLALIFLGFLLERINPEKNKKRLAIFIMVILVFCIPNFIGVRKYFGQLSNAETNAVQIETEDVFPNTARITLSQQRNVINYIESIQRQNGFPVYIKTLHEIESTLWYQLEKDGIDYKGEINKGYAYRQGNYFLVFPTIKNMQSWAYLSNVETKTFGSLTVALVTPDSKFVLFDKQDSSMDTELEVKKEFLEVFTWDEFFETWNLFGHKPVKQEPVLYEEEPETGEADNSIDGLE